MDSLCFYCIYSGGKKRNSILYSWRYVTWHRVPCRDRKLWNCCGAWISWIGISSRNLSSWIDLGLGAKAGWRRRSSGALEQWSESRGITRTVAGSLRARHDIHHSSKVFPVLAASYALGSVWAVIFPFLSQVFLGFSGIWIISEIVFDPMIKIVCTKQHAWL